MTIRHLVIFFLVFNSTIACSGSKKIISTNDSPPFVILKLDDLWCKEGVVHQGWESVILYLNSLDIKCGIGLIGDSLEEDNPDYFNWIKARASEGHEIWNHGFCHCRNNDLGESEFRGKGEIAQVESINKTQALAKENLGLTLRTFGAPYNWTDKNTVSALEGLDELKVWLYKETNVRSGKFVLDRIKEVNIEYPVHQPNFNQFLKGYEKYKDEPVLVIQGHPRSWVEDKERMKEFKRIITFLKKEKVRFVTPYEYYLMNMTTSI